MTKVLIPEAALDKHIAFLGATGSGKTSVVKAMIIEPALDRDERVVIVDPTAAYWGLRLSRTGKSAGHAIPIFGGDHADYPLNVKDAAAPIVRQATQPNPKTVPVRPPKTNLYDDHLPGPERRIINALASWKIMGHPAPNNAQVAWLAGYSPKSTGYTNPRSGLRTKGLLEYPSRDQVALTPDGAAIAVGERPPGVLLDHVVRLLPGPEGRILVAVAARHPDAVPNAIAAEDAGYSPTSTGYTNPRSSLRTKSLIDYPGRDMVRAADWLFQ